MDLTVTEYLEYCAALRYIPDREIPQAVKKVLERCGTVSYTHLDVYKRQIARRPRISWNSCLSAQHQVFLLITQMPVRF